MIPSVPIIVVGYNRPKAIERLLNSLLGASYPGVVDLIISIDGRKGEEGRGRTGEEVRGRLRDGEKGRKGEREKR